MNALHPTNIGDEFVQVERSGPQAPSRVRTYRKMQDTDLMPFGHFRGTAIGEIPAWYLDNLRDANWLDRYPAVAEYLEHNAAAIDKELDEPRHARDDDRINPRRDEERWEADGDAPGRQINSLG